MSARTKSRPLLRDDLAQMEADGVLHISFAELARFTGEGIEECKRRVDDGSLPVRTFGAARGRRVVFADVVALLGPTVPRAVSPAPQANTNTVEKGLPSLRGVLAELVDLIDALSARRDGAPTSTQEAGDAHPRHDHRGPVDDHSQSQDRTLQAI